MSYSARNKYIPLRCKFEFRTRCFTLRGPKQWFKLPYVVQAAASLIAFKQGIRELWSIDGDLGIT